MQMAQYVVTAAKQACYLSMPLWRSSVLSSWSR